MIIIYILFILWESVGNKPEEGDITAGIRRQWLWMP